MNKFVSAILCLIFGFSLGFAHSDDPEKVEKRMREVQEYKMKFLAQEMELSDAQKKNFFELYEEMSQQKRQCYQEAMKLERKIKHEPQASEEDYQQLSEALNKANSQWNEEEKVYNEKFSEFLTQKQIYKMREAENAFRSKFEEMKHNRKRDHQKKADDKK